MHKLRILFHSLYKKHLSIDDMPGYHTVCWCECIHAAKIILISTPRNKKSYFYQLWNQS